ncbi:MAG TPA: ATP-binding protein [Solirubrobacteraceae bacterium]|nr:ATP-binding protein [Solirubrobacteraceae bacterium]
MRSTLGARLLPRSLRWRLSLALCGVLVLAFVVTFVVVYGEVQSRLRGEVDHTLRAQSAAFATALTSPRGALGARAVSTRARRYVRTQPFTSSSMLLFAIVPGEPVATNHPELLDLVHEPPDATAFAHALRSSPPGFSTPRMANADAGLRVYMTSLALDGGARARLAVAQSLQPVDDATDDITRSFAIGGTITLAVALLAGVLLAAGFARPLARMARIAARVDAGDLSPRIEYQGLPDETRILADAFDHMLDRLEEAFARQQAFVSDASHELRTPLTAIRGQLEVLARRESPDAAEVRRVQGLVQAEVDRMTRLTEDLLLLAHTDESRFIRREAVALEPFLADLLESAQATTDRRLTLDARTPGILNADPDRLAQALRNLIRNAVEQTPDGGRIELGASEAADGRARIWVDDDGPGIDEAERDRVFDRFHRADLARARAGGGTGLGLAIVRAIAEAHGGRAWASTSPLGGARVVIELPGYRRRQLV